LPLHLINRQVTDFRNNNKKAMNKIIKALLKSDDSAAPRKTRRKLSPKPDNGNFFNYLGQFPNSKNNKLVARDLYRWGNKNADKVEFGGKVTPGFHVRTQIGEDEITLFSVWAYPRKPAVQIQFQYLSEYQPYSEYKLRLSTLQSIGKLADVPFIEDKADRRPTLPLDLLDTAEKLETFKQIMQEIIDNLHSV